MRIAGGEEAAEEERDGDDDQVHDADALVVLRQQPRRHAVPDVQIVHARDATVVVMGPYIVLCPGRRGVAAACVWRRAGLSRGTAAT